MLGAAGASANPVNSGEPTLDELLGLTPESESPRFMVDDDTSPTAVAPAPPLEPTLSEPPAEVFEQALADMRQAADRLSFEQDPGIDTQRLQHDVIAKLDRVIEQLEQQSSQGGQSSQGDQQKQDVGSKPGAAEDPGPRGTSPARNVGARGNPEYSDNAAALAERVDTWGNLPPRLRDELLQGLEDRFSPLYRRLTELYYQRLAEEAQ